MSREIKLLSDRIRERSSPPDPETGCIEFVMRGEYNPNRAMYLKVEGKTLSVLKVVWELHHGKPTNQMIRHTCKNRRCINPAHLKVTA